MQLANIGEENPFWARLVLFEVAEKALSVSALSPLSRCDWPELAKCVFRLVIIRFDWDKSASELEKVPKRSKTIDELFGACPLFVITKTADGSLMSDKLI